MVNHRFTGKGEIRFNNGDIYVGDLVDRVRTGKGEYYFANGDRYVGGFLNGHRHGKGTFYVNGFRFERVWKSDRPPKFSKLTKLIGFLKELAVILILIIFWNDLFVFILFSYRIARYFMV